MASTKYRSVTTEAGIPADVAKSALRKYIRRGMLTEAVSMAIDIHKFHYAKNNKAVITNFYNQFRIAVLEEIGIAFPSLCLRVDPLLIEWRDEQKLESLLQVTHMLCTVIHSRFYSHIRAYFSKVGITGNVNCDYPLSYDDMALKNIVGFLINSIESSSVISTLSSLTALMKKKSTHAKYGGGSKIGYLAFDILKKYHNSPTIDKCFEWYKTFPDREVDLCVYHAYCSALTSIEDPPTQEFKCETVAPLVPPIYDFCYDLHTKQGRSLGRNAIDFASGGSLVAYGYDVQRYYYSFIGDYDVIYRNYVSSKCSLARWVYRHESNEFKFKARAQLTCSKSRPDSYFVEMWNGESALVKGPYLTDRTGVNQNIIFNIQSVIGLFSKVSSIRTTVCDLYADRFPNVKIGTRVKSIGFACPFIIMEDVLGLKEYPTVVKNSKYWKNEPVVNYTEVFRQIDAGFVDAINVCPMVYAIALRWIFEMGDFAARNFLRVENRAYILDTEAIFVSKTVTLSKSVKQAMINWHRDHQDEWRQTLEEWLGPGNGYCSRWLLIRHALKLMDTEVEQIRANLVTMRDRGPSAWL